MTFFPHLVAGPIMRFSDFNARRRRRRERSPPMPLATGAFMLVGGLFLKIVGADQVFAPVSDIVFAPDYKAGFVAAWAGAFSFSMQVYCDFAGYSLAALGIAKCSAFICRRTSRRHSPRSALPSCGPAGTFRSRTGCATMCSTRSGITAGPVRGYLNVMITFTACGFWHGAAWHFVVWGAMHGAFSSANAC